VRGRPADGHYTKRTAEAWLRDVLDEARRGTLPGLVRTGVTVADACEDYLPWLETDQERKATTLRDYGSIIRVHIVPALGDLHTPPWHKTSATVYRALQARRSPHADAGQRHLEMRGAATGERRGARRRRHLATQNQRFRRPE